MSFPELSDFFELYFHNFSCSKKCDDYSSHDETTLCRFHQPLIILSLRVRWCTQFLFTYYFCFSVDGVVCVTIRDQCVVISVSASFVLHCFFFLLTHLLLCRIWWYLKCCMLCFLYYNIETKFHFCVPVTIACISACRLTYKICVLSYSSLCIAITHSS